MTKKETERVDHILRYGGRCRDCADNFGICEYSGLPCNPDVARKAIKHVLEADEHYHNYYGIARTAGN